MKGLDPTERSVMEMITASATACWEGGCGKASEEFTPAQAEAVWKLVARGLAVATPCDCIPGMSHISITHTGLLILALAKTEET